MNRVLRSIACIALAASVSTAIAQDIPALIGKLGSANVVERESAMRALKDLPAAVVPVTEALAADDLTRRVSAMELLEDWHAPVDGIDPWERASITPQRLDRVREWAKQIKTFAPAPATQQAATIAGEVEQLLGASTDAEVKAVRERLARFGDRALAAVVERLKTEPSTELRRRLTAARYRIVASEKLMLDWPAGPDQLTSPDAAARQAAATELGQHATADDAGLLRELFSDPDPFLREQALRTLRTIGGAESNKTLVLLLADPDANVRAAVLKALSEDEAISADLAADLSKYVATETDADLVCHAVRVLKAVPGTESTTAIRTLLTHPRWEVRAEALEALTPRLKVTYGDKQLPQKEAAAIYLEIIKRLEDEEPFVVSRAVTALSGRGAATSAAAMFKAIERKPDLAPEILAIFSSDAEMSKSAWESIKPLAKHERANVRAAAVRALAASRDMSVGPQMRDAVLDPESSVREAGIAGGLVIINAQRPRDGYVETSGFLGFGSSRKRVNLVEWTADFRAGKGRAKWVGDVADALEKSLEGLSVPGRADAAVFLVAAGRDAVAIPVLNELATRKEAAPNVAQALVWLPEEQCVALFKTLSAELDAAGKSEYIEVLSAVSSKKVQELLWSELAARPGVDDYAEVLLDALEQQYTGEYGDLLRQMSAADRKAIADEITVKASSGPEVQRAVALAMLMTVNEPDASAIAEKLADDTTQTLTLRRDAVQLVLVGADDDAGAKHAVRYMEDASFIDLAVRYLAGGKAAISRGEGNTRLLKNSGYSDFMADRNAKWEGKAPDGLKVDLLKPLLVSPIPELPAYAAYLLVLSGDREAFATLDKAWPKEEIARSKFTRLVYRAIAAMNDDGKTPVLEQIYEAYKADGRYNLRDFYWTIRSMKGESVLKLRKRMRDEIGMDELR